MHRWFPRSLDHRPVSGHVMLLAELGLGEAD